MKFQYMGLSAGLLRAVADAGYEKPTPIQWQAIPAVLQKKDVLGIAQTGTGKTAGFTLPMIDRLASGQAKARMPRSLILEPTRELAAQVADSFEKYGKNHNLSMALLIGGVQMNAQTADLDRGVDVLIATPGRLLDHLNRGNLMLSGIQILVIDEADRMLDMGFVPDVEEICSKISQDHQTLFFSATMPPPIKKLADKFLNDPKVVETDRTSSTADTIEQSLLNVAPRGKRDALRKLLRGDDVNNAIVFCNRKIEVKDVYKTLKGDKLNVGQLHGDMAQSERMEVLKGFKDGDIRILVASDVAARGLDIPSVSHVFNYDIPHTAEDYVHRIGRTGRAGRKGFAVTLATRSDGKYVDAIEKLTQNKFKLHADSGVAQAPAADGDKKSAKKSDKAEQPAKKASARKPRGKKEAPKDSVAPADKPASTSEATTDSAQDKKPTGGANRDDRNRGEAKAAKRQNSGPKTGQHQKTGQKKTATNHAQKSGRTNNSGRGQDQNTPLGFGDNVPNFLK